MRREDVIRKIVEREVQGQSLSTEAAARDAKALYSAACEHFGTWDTALRYAGISLRRAAVEDQYSPDRVLHKLRTLCCNGYDLSARRVERRDRRLVETARQHFGSWRKALLTAGINLEQLDPVAKSDRLDQDGIIQELHRRHRAGLTLKWSDVSLENRAFALNVKYVFGSWRRGLAAAGLAPPGQPAKVRARSVAGRDTGERGQSGQQKPPAKKNRSRPPCSYRVDASVDHPGTTSRRAERDAASHERGHARETLRFWTP